MSNSEKYIIIIGAGPAGLSCAYYFIKHTNIKPIIIEQSNYIGGISKTIEYKGNRTDIGGHRFFTKNDEVKKFWTEIFPIENSGIEVKDLEENSTSEKKVFLKRHRLSRIYFLKKFFDYPISLGFNTFRNLGIFNILKSGFYYLISCFFKRKENSLEDFYINRFGKGLYELFFEDYTEKVWGKHPSNIAPDWGKQRVKGLSLISVIKNCLLKPFLSPEKTETSLIEEFLYPPKGPGQFYEELARIVTDHGAQIIFNNCVVRLNFTDNNISSVTTKDTDGTEHCFNCTALFSSMPIKDLVGGFNNNDINETVKNIADDLPYRDFITVGLLINKFAIKNNSKYKTETGIIPDCWIYIQEKNVKIGRLQIFNNWSPYMVKDYKNSVWIGLEYFCNENDELWNMNDDDFINTASCELVKIGLVNKEDILDGIIIREKKAYPAYFGSYKNFNELRKYLDSIDNLYCIGRNGQHRYNNMDHSILTGFEAARAFINHSSKEKIWNVNTETEYHESK